MEVIAKALVMAVQYIADRDESATEADDVAMLEQVAAMLQQSGAREQKALITAAQELKLPEWPTQIGLVRE